MQVDDVASWYRAGDFETSPFSLTRVVHSNDTNVSPFHTTACFPWAHNSLDTLWDGLVTDEKTISDHHEMVRDWQGSIAVGSTGRMFVFPKLATTRPFAMNVPNPTQAAMPVQCIAWALSLHFPTNPLVVFAIDCLLFIVDAKTQKLIGRLRGHGGAITSIAVHPIHPYLLCTTSRDFTTRIYDITIPPRQSPNNPPWPPAAYPSRAGAAHGLQMSIPEGDGIGCCVAVLCGGRSGGHQAAVLSAAFHRTQNIIATCGMDRAVKIWRLPLSQPEVLAREDKPLFSTDCIHTARVLSISWLSDDILVSHSAPTVMRRSENTKDTYPEEGTVTIWRWLGYDRYFPPGKPRQKVMRGTASDYRQSESFKIITTYFLPMSALKLDIFIHPRRDPLILVPMGKSIRIINITHLKPRIPPEFPRSEDAEVTRLAKRLHIDDDDLEDDADQDTVVRPRVSRGRIRSLFNEVNGWNIRAFDGQAMAQALNLPDIDGCEMAFDGEGIIGYGKSGTLWIWRIQK